MKRKSGKWILVAGTVCMFAGRLPVATAEEATVQMLAPWESEGRVFRIAEDTVLFQGASEGILYIERGGALDAAIFSCPGSYELNTNSGDLSANGRCAIKDAEDQGLIFADYSCEGKPGSCKGMFTITSGTGKFKGISGSGEMVVRTALADIAADLSTGEVVRSATGLAVWPELKYTFPSR